MALRTKKKWISLLTVIPLLMGCDSSKCVVSENKFFLIMDNLLLYPEEYVNKEISLDCFTYNIEDIHGEVTTCGVRKCPSGYGCKCGKDTVIGFILNYDGEIPEPRNQYEDSVEKTWIHLVGRLAGETKTTITIYSSNPDGTISTDTEKIQFLTLNVENLELIEDYQNLHYYVTN